MIRTGLAILAVFLGLLTTQSAAPAQAEPATRPSYDVRAFGATGDGKTKDTAAFQKALDACAVNGGGDVLVPAGNYLIGSIQIGNATTLRLDKDATLTGSPDMADYPLMDVRWEGRWEQGHRALIYAGNVDHIGIAGAGHITGNATLARRAAVRGPVLIEPISCNDVHLDGFSTQNWSLWSTHPTYCTDLVIEHLTVRNNSDGMDIDSCNRVRIDSCDISSGDDSISLKSGRGMDGARIARPCENVLITNCTLADRTFACIGIGSETSGGVRNVRIEHCKFV
ncbi:MAG: glycosyl hydrolase family 28 protein, partial [Tepidisphaeraceae bacterium]